MKKVLTLQRSSVSDVILFLPGTQWVAGMQDTVGEGVGGLKAESSRTRTPQGVNLTPITHTNVASANVSLQETSANTKQTQTSQADAENSV